MFRTVILKVLLIALFCESHSFNPLLRKTWFGFVRGTLNTSRLNPEIRYLSFLGIPYAIPPIGKFRFRETRFPAKWNTILETNQYSSSCLQIIDDLVVGNEDCLYLNIFVPARIDVAMGPILPVIFHIHGGGFSSGSSSDYHPDLLMERDVVIVTIQYRLGVMGFLSTLTEEAPGNVGLKDQLLALRWVKDNIAGFGGDPDRITIFGEEAGAVSVQYHLLSTRSRGLFRGAFGYSGSALNRWAYQKKPVERAIRLATSLGIRGKSTRKKLVDVLQSLKPEVIVKTALNISDDDFFFGLYDTQRFVPVVENEHSEAFISQGAFQLMEAGNCSRVPYVMGYSNDDLFYIDVLPGIKLTHRLVSPSFNVSQHSLCTKWTEELIKKFYLKKDFLTNTENWNMGRFVSQELFTRGIQKSLELLYNHMPFYFYKFSYKNGASVTHPAWRNQLNYIWYARRSKYYKKDVLTRKRLVSLLTNFATYGRPVPHGIDPFWKGITWNPVTNDSLVSYLEIGDSLISGHNPDLCDRSFWAYLFTLCGNSPYETY